MTFANGASLWTTSPMESTLSMRQSNFNSHRTVSESSISVSPNSRILLCAESPLNIPLDKVPNEQKANLFEQGGKGREYSVKEGRMLKLLNDTITGVLENVIDYQNNNQNIMFK